MDRYDMTQVPEHLRPIVAILLEHEIDISDGYGYYCDVIEKLTIIADKIYREIAKESDKRS